MVSGSEAEETRREETRLQIEKEQSGLKVLFSIKVHWKVGTGLWQNPLAKADFARRYTLLLRGIAAEGTEQEASSKLQQSFQAQFSL